MKVKDWQAWTRRDHLKALAMRVEGHPFKVIARELGRSPDAVRVRLSRARHGKTGRLV